MSWVDKMSIHGWLKNGKKRSYEYIVSVESDSFRFYYSHYSLFRNLCEIKIGDNTIHLVLLPQSVAEPTTAKYSRTALSIII